MNSRHVYIGNYYSFPTFSSKSFQKKTFSSKYKAYALGDFLIFFMKFFLKIKKGIDIK
jgi:hypothetical protein